MLPPRICASRSLKSLFSLPNAAISVGHTKVKSFGQKKYSLPFAFVIFFRDLLKCVVPVGADCGGQFELSGNFSPTPNMSMSIAPIRFCYWILERASWIPDNLARLNGRVSGSGPIVIWHYPEHVLPDADSGVPDKALGAFSGRNQAQARGCPT